MMCASLAWWGYATAADKKRIQAFVRRGVRLGLYHANAGATGHQQRRQTLQQRIDEQSPRAEATAA